MPKPQPFLSKSRFMDGMKCHKYVWYKFNKPEAIPEADPGTQARFDQGTIVGEWAQKLYPLGVKVVRDQMPEVTHARSMEALKLRKPLFEAGMIYGSAYALPDILVPVEGNSWDLIEVKSSKEVKEHYLPDVAFQKYVYTGAGIKIRRCYLMYVNNKYLRKGKIEPKKLFTKEDITERIKPYEKDLKKSIKELLDVISDREPKVKIGPQCSAPYDCPLEKICWDFLPKGDIFQLYRGSSKKLFELLDKGILKLKDIPIEDWLNEKHLLQIKSHKTGKAHINREEIKSFLDSIKYPLYFLDFETINPAIPAYDLIHPFEQLPFQFSLHVIEKEGAKPVHHSYLAPGDVDPRPEVLKRLKSLLGSSGTIVAYRKSTEIGCIKRSADAFPDYKEWSNKLEKRFVDLLVPFQKFYYYHPDQEGSASLKYVLPALTDSNYEGLDIAEGGAASREYMRVTFGDNIDEKDRQKVRQALEEYCQLDTQAMIDVLEGLREAGQ